MKITWVLNKDEKVILDTGRENGPFLIGFRKPEEKETTKQNDCVPPCFRVKEEAKEDVPDGFLHLSEEKLEKLYSLTDIQRRRYLKHKSGMSFIQIAIQEGVIPSSVKDSVYAALRKMGE